MLFNILPDGSIVTEQFIVMIIVFKVMDLDRRVRRGRERLDQEDVPPPPPPISAEKSEQLSVLEEKIKNLLEQVESLGEAGQVDEAEALMRKVSQITSVVRAFQKKFHYSFIHKFQ